MKLYKLYINHWLYIYILVMEFRHGIPNHWLLLPPYVDLLFGSMQKSAPSRTSKYAMNVFIRKKR